MSANHTDGMSQLLREMATNQIDSSSASSAEINLNMISDADCSGILDEENGNGNCSIDRGSTSNRSAGSNFTELSSESDLFTTTRAANSGLFYCLKPPRQAPGANGSIRRSRRRRLAAFDPLSDDVQFARIVLPCSAMPPSAAVIVSSVPSCELATRTSWDNSSSISSDNDDNYDNEATTDLATKAENCPSNRSSLLPDTTINSSACVSSDGDDFYVTPPEILPASSCAVDAAAAAALPVAAGCVSVQLLGSTPSHSESKRRRIANANDVDREAEIGENRDLEDKDRLMLQQQHQQRRRSQWLRRLLEHPLLATSGEADLRLSDNIRAVIEADLAASAAVIA